MEESIIGKYITLEERLNPEMYLEYKDLSVYTLYVIFLQLKVMTRFERPALLIGSAHCLTKNKGNK